MIVGLNAFTSDDKGEDLEILKIGEAARAAQTARVQQVRAARDDHAVQATLAALRAGCASTANVMPLLIDCAHAYCTIEEIIGTMKDVFGEYHDPGIF